MKFELKNLEGVDYPFSIDKEFGRFIFSNDTELDLVPFSNFIISVLSADARMILPPKTPFEIRSAIPGDFGRYKVYCWIYKPDWEKKEDIPIDGKWRGNYAEGCLRAGRFLT